MPRIAVGTIGAPVSRASRPAPWWGEPSASGSSTRVPSGNTTTTPPAPRIARAVASASASPSPRRTGNAPSLPSSDPNGPPEQLRLGHEADPAARGETDEERVEEALVVRGHDRGAALRHVLGARDAEPEPRAQPERCEDAHDAVEPSRLARVRCAHARLAAKRMMSVSLTTPCGAAVGPGVTSRWVTSEPASVWTASATLADGTMQSGSSVIAAAAGSNGLYSSRRSSSAAAVHPARRRRRMGVEHEDRVHPVGRHRVGDLEQRGVAGNRDDARSHDPADRRPLQQDRQRRAGRHGQAQRSSTWVLLQDVLARGRRRSASSAAVVRS